ncbi:hypothetical protein [Roseibium algae]|uniref:Uncharacterized protein n=1 Tax=Roseibium algae TaxID=3123038 RepID=A0ABU8TRK8_9HYPH
MMTAPKTIDELFSRFGKIARFAEEVGCGYEAARQMKRRRRITPKYWTIVVDACERRQIAGVDLEWLARRHSVLVPPNCFSGASSRPETSPLTT